MKDKQDIEKLLANLDFRGFAEAHAKGQMNWHENEWREFIELIQQKERERIMEVMETICNESEWECPEHGKELRITPPLCKECNQCFEVNVIVANLYRSIVDKLK